MTDFFVRRRAALVSIALVAILAGPAAAGEPGPGRPRRARLARFGKMNLIDNALFDLAEFYMGEGRTSETVAVLGRIAGETPDRQTRSMAHFNLATIHETILDDPDRARAEYARVTGPMAAGARSKILRPLRAQKRWGEAVDFLKECLAACEEPTEKAKVIRTLTAIAKTSGDDKLLETTLRSVPDLVTYEEARAAAEAEDRKLAEMRKKIEAAGGGRADAAAAQPRPGHRDEAPPPTVRGRRGAGGATRARPVKSAAKIEEQIRELERAGFHDEAQRLREELRKLRDAKAPDQF